jgi:cytidyltransferase-like protein
MGLTIVTNGKFDVLHTGHFNILNFCRTIAGPDGEVIVFIDSDYRVAKQNCYGPVVSEEIRRINLKRLMCGTRKMVDLIGIFSTDESLHFQMKENKPDFIVKGSEWAGQPVIGQDLAQVIFFKDTENGFDKKISSSQIIEWVRRRLEGDDRS